MHNLSLPSGLGTKRIGAPAGYLLWTIFPSGNIL